MSAPLSNNWNDLTLVKLDTSPGSEGPFIVAQDAVDADDSTQTPCTWLLRTDGRWIRLVHQVLLPEPERELVWFENAREVMGLLGSLPELPSIQEVDADEARLREAVGKIREMSVHRLREIALEWKSHREE